MRVIKIIYELIILMIKIHKISNNLYTFYILFDFENIFRLEYVMTSFKLSIIFVFVLVIVICNILFLLISHLFVVLKYRMMNTMVTIIIMIMMIV